ncbi:MAG: hypothetical protein ACJ736_08580 [Streptomyces sp.]
MNPPHAALPRARPLWPTACTLTAAAAPLAAAVVSGPGTARGHHHGGLADDALGFLTAVVVFTSAVSWPALRVALRPDRYRTTPGSALLATAGALALALPLAMARPLSGVDAHLWAMARFELLAGLGPALLARAARASDNRGLAPGGGGRAGIPGQGAPPPPVAVWGAAVWTVTAYMWHLSPLHALEGPGARTAQALSWMSAGLLLWAPALAPGRASRGPLVAAHLAALPLGLAMLLTGSAGAGALMLAADAAMAGCLLGGRASLRRAPSAVTPT